MKGFLTILSMPAVILPVLATPLSSQSQLQTKATGILASLYDNVAPMNAKIEQEVAALNGKSPSAAQLSTMSGGMQGIIDEIVAAVGLLTEAVTAIDKRSVTPDSQSELEDQLKTTVTDIAMMVAAVHKAPNLDSKLGSEELDTLTETSAMGDPLSSLLPVAGEVINAIILEAVGQIPSIP